MFDSAGVPVAGRHDVTVEAFRDDQVVLPCRLDPERDLSGSAVEWHKLDTSEDVHVYRRGKDEPGLQAERYRNRTSLCRDDLPRGILNLAISSVQLEHSGPYQCFVPDIGAICLVNLSVGESNTERIRLRFKTVGMKLLMVTNVVCRMLSFI